MSNRQIVLLVVILALIGLTVWILLPSNPGLLGRPIQFRLGLDLVGGVQALLEADLPADATVTTESMQTARSIVENRVNGLGVTEAVVQQAGTRRLIVELPGETDPEKALATIRQTGLLEFVDFSTIAQQDAISLVNQTIKTDFGQTSSTTQNQPTTGQTHYRSNPPGPGVSYHHDWS